MQFVHVLTWGQVSIFVPGCKISLRSRDYSPNFLEILGYAINEVVTVGSSVARLAFLGQIWPCFKLVGLLKKFSWPFLDIISSWLALKNMFGVLTLFWPFLRWNRFLWRKTLLFHFFRQHVCNIFVINAIVDAHIQILVNIWGMLDSKLSLHNHWKCVHSMYQGYESDFLSDSGWPVGSFFTSHS